MPKNQIFISGHSCGGWLTMMFMAKHLIKLQVDIHHPCYGKLSTKYKVKKVGVDEALKKFEKKPVASYFRKPKLIK